MMAWSSLIVDSNNFSAASGKALAHTALNSPKYGCVDK